MSDDSPLSIREVQRHSNSLSQMSIEICRNLDLPSLGHAPADEDVQQLREGLLSSYSLG